MSKTITELCTTLYQKINGAIRKVYHVTLAKLVIMADGSDLQTTMDTLSRAVSSQTTSYVVSDIAARDAIATPHVGDQAWVEDATADATVKLGAAKYIYKGDIGEDGAVSNGRWVKTAEAESMDLIIKWADIQDKPANSVTEIDAAVTATKQLSGHELTVSDDTGALLLDGAGVGGKYGAYVTVGPEDEGFDAAVAALNLPDGAIFTVVQP